MTVLPFPDWKPDLPDLATATTVALNVIPLTAQSYGPLNSLSSYSSTALDGKCIGAVTAQATDGTISVFAGTADKLYQMTAASLAWADVSQLGGYAAATGESWVFHAWGQFIFATDFDDPIQVFIQGSSTLFADLSADAPMARYMCSPKNFLMVGNTFDSVGGFGPTRVWWSASNDPTTWPIPGSASAQQNQSDFNDFQGDWGEITGLADSLASADVAIFFKEAVWRGVYSGPPDVFDFFPCENVRGCVCPNGIVLVGSDIFYPAVDGFYKFDGSQSQPVGVDKFDIWFWATVNRAFLWNVVGAADVKNRAVIWIFPSNLSSTGIPDTVLIYRWDLQRASYAQFSAEWIMRVLSFGVTLDTFSTLGFTNLDTIPASLDSVVWVGGALSLGAIDVSHKLAYFTGSTLQAQIGTQTLQPTPNLRSFVNETRPLVQQTAGTSPTIALAGRNNIYDPIVYGTATSTNANGICPQRLVGRYFNGLMTVAAGAAWTQALGIDANAEPMGER